MRIVDLLPDDHASIQQAARALMEGFAQHAPESWPDMGSALAEVRESFGPGRISRVALDQEGRVLGWIGGIQEYGGHAWELHPLVVCPKHQGQGVGTELVRDLEARVRERGATTLYLFTDDEDGRTSLADRDLYPDVLSHLQRIRNPGRHPYAFYQKMGFVITGVLPDANGPGKPDILMAKRLAPPEGAPRQKPTAGAGRG